MAVTRPPLSARDFWLHGFGGAMAHRGLPPARDFGQALSGIGNLLMAAPAYAHQWQADQMALAEEEKRREEQRKRQEAQDARAKKSHEMAVARFEQQMDQAAKAALAAEELKKRREQEADLFAQNMLPKAGGEGPMRRADVLRQDRIAAGEFDYLASLDREKKDAAEKAERERLENLRMEDYEVRKLSGPPGAPDRWGAFHPTKSPQQYGAPSPPGPAGGGDKAPDWDKTRKSLLKRAEERGQIRVQEARRRTAAGWRERDIDFSKTDLEIEHPSYILRDQDYADVEAELKARQEAWAARRAAAAEAASGDRKLAAAAQGVGDAPLAGTETSGAPGEGLGWAFTKRAEDMHVDKIIRDLGVTASEENDARKDIAVIVAYLKGQNPSAPTDWDEVKKRFQDLFVSE